MTKRTKIFRVIIHVILTLTVLCSALFSLLFVLHIEKDVMDATLGIYVADVPVTKNNDEDVLGDGTVYYDAYNNILTFNNATIESESAAVHSTKDLNIVLIGENKFICKNAESIYGIYAADNYLYKDLYIGGDGSLTIEFQNASTNAAGIFADNLMIQTDVTITTPDCENIVSAIVCDSSLNIANKATLTVTSGSGMHCSAVRVRGNAFLEEETALNISVNPGAIESCKGLNINGDLILRNRAALNVAIDDENVKTSECIRVTGLLSIENDSTVTATSKVAHAIECYGSVKADEGTAISAVSDKKDADIFCSGAVINSGAEIDAVIDAVGGIRNKAEN